MRNCKKCGEAKEDSEFTIKQSSKGRSYRCWTCHACIYKRSKEGFTEESRERARIYARKWAKEREGWCKYKAYRFHDKRRGAETVSWQEFLTYVGLPCYYCGSKDCKGLDRIDNAKGHSTDNVRPCCEKCNMILGDIPDGAKKCLVSGLTRARKKGYLLEWIIPTKRKK